MCERMSASTQSLTGLCIGCNYFHEYALDMFCILQNLIISQLFTHSAFDITFYKFSTLILYVSPVF